MDEISEAKRDAWDECVHQMFMIAARGPVWQEGLGLVREFPSNPYREGSEEWAREGQMRDISLLRANAWDEGFNFGHYIEGEREECDCRENPYRDGGE